MSPGGDHADQPREHAGGPHTAAEGHQHGASIERAGVRVRSAGGTGEGWFASTSAPAMPASSSPSDRHQTSGVTVLRRAGATRSTATSRPTSRPAAPGRPGATVRSLTFAQWGPGGRPAWPAGWPRSGVVRWRRGRPCCCPSSIDYALLYAAAAAAGGGHLGHQSAHGPGRDGVEHRGPGRPPVLTVQPIPSLRRGRSSQATGPCRWWSTGPRRWPARWTGRRRPDRWPTSWRPTGPGGRGVDQWHHRDAERGALRSRQPGRGGCRHRRPVGTRRPPALPPAVRPCRLHDPDLGRDRPRGDHHHHADAMAGGRCHPDHGRGADHRGPGRADAVGADAGPG